MHKLGNLTEKVKQRRERLLVQIHQIREQKDKRFVIPLAIVLVLACLGIWFLLVGRVLRTNGALKASGTVETIEVAVSSETAGRVAEVLVDEGDSVEAGDPLLRLDDELLQTQRKRASAALESAKANLATSQIGLDLAQASLEVAKANGEATIANSKVELLSAKKALDELYSNEDVASAKALQAVAAANRALHDSQYLLDNFTVPNNQADLTAMEAISMTKEKLDNARLAFEPYRYASLNNSTREDLKETLDEAQSDYNAAVRRLEYESSVDQAKAQVVKAMEDLQKLENSPDPDQVAIFEARIAAAETAPKQVEAAIKQAEDGVPQAEAKLEQAQAALNQTQAELDLIGEQLKKLVVLASTSGIVLSRDIETGEVVQPGTALMMIGQIDNLTITVYVPEDRYGKIKLGMKARVTADSFPGERFEATVIRIADKAEFTPRNVQTEEGRRTTVFAVELSVANPKDKLKPGMPVDVNFGN